MTRRIVWGFLVFLCCICVWAPPSFAEEAGDEAHAGPHTVVTPAEGEDDERVWIESGSMVQGRKASIVVRYPEDQPSREPVVFECEIESEVTVEEALARVTVKDRDGVVLHQGELGLGVGKGASSCRFSWDASEVSPGFYTARIEVLRRPVFVLAYRELLVRKLSLSELCADLDGAQQQIQALHERLAAFDSTEEAFPYARLRLAITEDFAPLARTAIADKQWRRADRMVEYLKRATDSVRANLVFAGAAPELVEPIPRPDLGGLCVRDGAFYAGGRPVFLMGACGWDQLAHDLPRLRRYGLNLAVVGVGPNETLANRKETAGFRKKLAPLFKAAQKNNVSVTVSLLPHAMPEWALERYPAMAQSGLGAVDIAQPGARRILAQHVRTLVPYLSKQRMLNSLCLAHKPAFRFADEEVRERFLALVRERYPDRHTLNQSWRAIFADFEDLDIGWVETGARYQESPAYQYDWQTYHQALGGEFFAWLVSQVRKSAPDTSLHVAFSGGIFEPGESKAGIDQEAVAALLDISGCCATNTRRDRFYALGYPQQALVYTLLKSLAPDKPVFNVEDRIIAENDPKTPYTFDYVHGALWEAAMAGLNASAAWVWDRSEALPELRHNILMRPECLEGYATACLDLNRLSPIVLAFQQAPAPVAIIWSTPSKIYGNGVPYLHSANQAFEGCSFSGYKVRFLTERQVLESQLADVRVLVIPETPAVSDEAFGVIRDYIRNGGVIVRTQAQIHYDQHGHSRRDILGNTARTVLVRGLNLPTEYLHAMDGVTGLGTLPPVPRTINRYGYPLEGVKSRYVELDGQGYLYVINIRKAPVAACLLGAMHSGRDLIRGRDVAFPTTLEPLDPMLIRLNMAEREGTVASVATAEVATR